ncbi:PTS sugar transporter subunit IIC [Loigolactobacillus rennini]|uniref:Membrane protein PfoR n=2 Tax=Loigolactobacillus rennini TaxID=238013 RepID=A0A0R2D607_9LACO|nr:PTS sugar transporter subunit IIC [Loigolactobacillus rennini]KRM99325.1 membrane protein PfoR [Loigolactobacillus rennini DSM 20253]SFZ89024.1 Transcriptional regulator pfoR [Loigolactobacillus rennini]
MEIILGVLVLLAVIAVMTLFTFKAPNGKKAIGALSGAACATFLPQAFLSYAVGGVFHVDFIKQIGDVMGSLGGLAAGALVPLAFGISPVFSILLGVSLLKFKLLPAFIAAYVVSFLIKQIQKRVTDGLDLIVVVLVGPILVNVIASLISPFVIGILQVIGGTITTATHGNPYVMGAVLGGIIPLVGMTPLSSMVLTSLIGLVGVPMAIGALGCFGNSILNFSLFRKLKFGSSTALAVTIEPLTQIDIISANPVPIFLTNMVAGAINGIIVTAFGLVVNVTGMATPWAGLIVVFGMNPVVQTLMAVALIMINSTIWAYIGAFIFKNFKIHTVEEIRGDDSLEEASAN